LASSHTLLKDQLGASEKFIVANEWVGHFYNHSKVLQEKISLKI